MYFVEYLGLCVIGVQLWFSHIYAKIAFVSLLNSRIEPLFSGKKRWVISTYVYNRERKAKKSENVSTGQEPRIDTVINNLKQVQKAIPVCKAAEKSQSGRPY